MNIECRTLLYQMMKNRSSMTREEAIAALFDKDPDPNIDLIRVSLLYSIKTLDSIQYMEACKEAAMHHLEEEAKDE